MAKIIGFSKAKNMVKLNENGTDTWYFLTPKVQQFIGNLKEGMEVEYSVEEKQGKKIIAFIKDTGNKSSGPIINETDNPSDELVCVDCGTALKDNKYETCYKCSMARKGKITPPSNKSSGYTCKDCGKELKDNQYETCYTCSMAKRDKENASPENQDKQKSIRAQAMGNMTSRTLIGLQGTYDINNVGEIIDTVFEHYNRNISKYEK